MAVPLIPIAILLTFLAFVLIRRFRFKLPPSPWAWPIIGNLYDIKPVRFWCYVEWVRAYGPIISVWFESTLNVIVSNTELAKEVLKEHDQQLANRHRSRSTARFSRDGKDLILADCGLHHVKVRKVFTLELFTPKRLDALRPIKEDEVTAMAEPIFKDCIASGTECMGGKMIRKRVLRMLAGFLDRPGNWVFRRKNSGLTLPRWCPRVQKIMSYH